MREVTQVEEKDSNPYNMNKPWHKPDGPPVETAEQMFFEKPTQATLEEEAPDGEEKTPKKRTNYKKRYDD